MTIRQLSVFLENRDGQLSEIADILSKSGVDLRAIHIAETTDYGILRMIANDPRCAAAALSESGYVLTVSEVLAVAVPDKPGGLAAMLCLLAREGIGIEYMYSVFGQTRGRAYMVFRADHMAQAQKVLIENGLVPVDEAELGIG